MVHTLKRNPRKEVCEYCLYWKLESEGLGKCKLDRILYPRKFTCVCFYAREWREIETGRISKDKKCACGKTMPYYLWQCNDCADKLKEKEGWMS